MPKIMDAGKKGLILVEKDENGVFREISEISLETEKRIEELKETVQETKIKINVLLPKEFRQNVNIEAVFGGLAAFTVPESVAREFSLMQ